MEEDSSPPSSGFNISSANELIGSAASGLYHFNDPFSGIRTRASTKEPVLLQANIVLACLTDIIKSTHPNYDNLSKDSLSVAYFGAILYLL